MADWYVSKEGINRAVRERDFVYLTGLTRNSDLSPELRNYLAEAILGLLTGKTKRLAHRPAKESTQRDGYEIALRVFELKRKGWPKLSAAVRQATTEFGCKDRKVWYSLKQFDEYVCYKEDDHDRLVRHHLRGVFTEGEMRQAQDEAEDWLADHAEDPRPTDEEVEAAGDAYLQWVYDFARGK